MDFRYAILLLILSQVAYSECIGYTDEFDVRVLDGKMRPVEGADVWIKFDRGTLFGDQYFTTEPRKTDSNGKVHFKVLNQGTLTRTIDCNILVNASSGGDSKKLTIEANKHGPIVDVQLDLYQVNFYVRDQLNAGIENASVTVGERSTKTNEYGLSRFYYKEGTYDYLANYKTAKQAGTMTIEDDVDFIVVFPYYDIVVVATDDFGEPLPATLVLGNETIVLQNGRYELNKTYGERIDYEISYKGAKESGEIVASENPRVEVVFDIHAPLFGNVVSETVNKRTKLTIPASDPGTYASGVDIQSFKANYRLEPADASSPWSSVLVFTTGFNTFAAEFPELPSNSIVQFRIEVKDKAGNKASLDGKFSTLETGNETTGNQSDTQETPEDGQGIPLFYIIAGIFVIILAIYLVNRIKSNT